VSTPVLRNEAKYLNFHTIALDTYLHPVLTASSPSASASDLSYLHPWRQVKILCSL